jgi:hypothetical protein
MEKKICKKCGEIKEICEFGKNNRKKDKINYICKSCDNLKSKNYRLNNKEKIKKLNSECYKNNKKEILSKSKEYYLINKETIIKKNKKYYFENIDAVKITKKKYRDNNKDHFNKKSKEYSQKNRKLLSQKDKERRNSDNLFRTIRYVRNRINQYFKSKNYKKDSKSFELVGCSPEFLKSHIESLFTDGMSWDLVGRCIHIDHIIPLSSGKTIDEVKKLCHYTNLQPLWAKDNLIKGKKITN